MGRFTGDIGMATWQRLAKQVGLLIVVGLLPRWAQGGAPASTGKYAPPAATVETGQEAYVVLEHRTRLIYQADGTGEKLEEARIRVQTEAGVNALGQLRWGYNAANENLKVLAVRVHKADGQTVTASPDAVQDLAPPGIDVAPIYTDLRMKVVTVPSLRPGDELDFSLRTVFTTPYAPGQFWGEYRFSRDEVILDETFELDTPKSKQVTIASAKGTAPVVREVGDRKITTWTWKHPVRGPQPPSDADKAKMLMMVRPDLQFTTFRSWAEVGDWYAGLEKPQRDLNEAIRAKAKSLADPHPDAMDKVRALYEFVATNNRYVSLSFGIGRFQPHKASEVLANAYGDCKDKNTLLAALLEAAGFKAHSVLIHHARALDPAIPSPAQFDHLITEVEVGPEKVFLDTTTEVAPFRALISPLRNKQALLVDDSGASHLVTTPSKNPMPNRIEITSTGEITDTGAVRVSIQEKDQGDPEILSRTIFRKVPQSRWRDIVSFSATMSGLVGEVGEIHVTDPSDLSTPFALTYGFKGNQELEGSGSDHELMIPLPHIHLQTQPEEDGSFQIGEGSAITRLSLGLPKGLRPSLPLGIRLDRDFGTYQSTYSFEGGRFTIERRLVYLKSELPASRKADFEAFEKLVDKDQLFSVNLEGAFSKKDEGGKGSPAALSQAALKAYEARDFAKARDLYERVASLDPKDKDVWNNLGRAYHALGAYNKAINAYKKAIALNPNEEYAYNNLGLTYWALKRYKAAEAMFRKQLEVNPYDKYAHANLGNMFMETKEFASAETELDQAARVEDKNATIRLRLGQAFLETGAGAKAVDAFEEAIRLSPDPMTRNNAAYELATHKIALDRAQIWAESAVADTVKAMRNLPLKPNDLLGSLQTSALVSFWDTLGWVYFQKGEFAKAKPYLQAAWRLSQSSEVGDHLGQLLLALGQKHAAENVFAEAAAAPQPVPAAREHLSALIGGSRAAGGWINKAAGELAAERTITFPAHQKSSGTANFIFALDPGGVVEDVQFVSGDASFKGMVEGLRKLNHHVPLPEGDGIRIFVRGLLVSEPSLKTVSLIFLTTDMVLPLVQSGQVMNLPGQQRR